jgi:methionine synthase II (cobalamin-independent)
VGPYSRDVDPARVRAELLALAEAGCSYIEVHEPAATDVVTGPEALAFAASHDRLLDGLEGVHLSLVITGGDAERVGIGRLLTAPFASLALDLIAGPDNWRVAAAAPREVGIVCGALSTEERSDDRPEVLLWAADYAASLAGRGPVRVGLSTAGSLAHLPWEIALRKLGLLGRVAGLADLPPTDRAAHLDPRAVDIRSAAMGRRSPPRTTPGS